jgi:hypothetical protein
VPGEDVPEASTPTIKSTAPEDFLSKFILAIGLLFKTLPGEIGLRFPIMETDEEDLLNAIESQAATRPNYPMPNGTFPQPPESTGSRTMIRQRQGPMLQ